MLNHHTWDPNGCKGVKCLGDLPYKESGVILPSSVKKDGFLRQHICVYFISVNIWVGKARKPHFKVEITSLVCI